MFISPTNMTSFQAGNVKLIGIRSQDLSDNFSQIFDFAKKREIDFSILKHSTKDSAVRLDTYSVIASKEPFQLKGIAVSSINKSADKEYLSLQIMGAILDAVDALNQKIKNLH